MSERTNASTPLAQGLGEDPLFQYIRIFTKFLQLSFASFPKGKFRWCEDLQLTDLVIQGEGTVNREVVEKRPAIIVSRGACAFTNVSLDQFAGPLYDPQTGEVTPNMDLETGTRRFTDLLSGSVSYNCLSKEGVEATRIAWTAAYATRVMKRALMKVGMHRVGEDIQVGSESSPGAIVQPDPGEIIMVSVSVPFFFQQTWTTAPADKTLLNQVTLALRSEVGYPAPGAAILKGPGMNGMPLRYDKRVSLNQVVVSNMPVGAKAKK